MITETLHIEYWGPSGTQHDAPERKPRGNSGAEDCNSKPKNTVENRKLERENFVCTRESRPSGESNDRLPYRSWV